MKNSAEFSNINGGKRDGEERDSVANQKEPHHQPCVEHVGREGLCPCGTRGPHVVLLDWPLAMLAPPALCSCSSAVSGPPNSDFKSIFGLQIMTPSHTMITTKI